MLLYDSSNPIFRGQNVRPPLGSIFNGESYQLTLYPERGNANRSVLVISMTLQFQFEDTDDGTWTSTEKTNFASDFTTSVSSAWGEKFRITTNSRVPARNLRDVGVIFSFTTYIDGYHLDDDFELTVKKIPSGEFEVSRCNYRLGNTYLDSEDAVPAQKGASMPQRGTVHEFGHMLGLRDEYPDANSNRNHLTDTDSIMHSGEDARERHYAPFAEWLTQQFRVHSRLAGENIEYRVNGNTTMANALL